MLGKARPDLKSESRAYIRKSTRKGNAMIETKIRRVGNSAVMTLTTEMLALLDAKEGDSLFVVRGDDGDLRIMTQDQSLKDVLDAAEIVMDENREALAKLA